ncbi:MAG: exopolyphosphatase [Rhodospirillales bacterium]|nr:exopolyphosphatase [Rhodospirillales bacterium]
MAKPVVAKNRSGRIGVIDIGSNTVRLVIYEAPTRLPFPLFNEKAQCGLGRSMARTGRLDTQGVEAARIALGRFVLLAEATGVDHLELVATAAVREASDGPEFVEDIEKRFGVKVDVIDGAEEAQLAARGVLSGVPNADGLLGDLGGGSLDLVVLEKGKFGRCETFPLGHLRLAEGGRTPAEASGMAAEYLEREKWLDEIKGRNLYALGGSWRAVAGVLLDRLDWPLHVIDNFSISPDEALDRLDYVARIDPKSWPRAGRISRRRVGSLPFAASALEMLIRRTNPARVIFSGFGMREGRMLSCLPEEVRRQDPLIAGCAGHAERSGRFSVHGEEITAWMEPLFTDTDADASGVRLRTAASLLSDISWSVHPDYRGENAFHRVLRLPFAGLSHEDRVELALAVFVRYGGDLSSNILSRPMSLLGERGSMRAVAVGRALHLAHTLSGGAPGLLSKTCLRRKRNRVVLDLGTDGALFQSEAVERRLGRLAKSMDLKPRIVSAED